MGRRKSSVQLNSQPLILPKTKNGEKIIIFGSCEWHLNGHEGLITSTFPFINDGWLFLGKFVIRGKT